MMNASYTKEASLLEPVSGYIRRKGFSRQQEELQFFEHRIDLYGFSPKEESTTAIELKLYKWRRALQQAMLYQLCADYVYMALPNETIPIVDQSCLVEHGIGLIAVYPGPRCRVVLPAERSPFVLNSYREFYHSILRGSDAA